MVMRNISVYLSMFVSSAMMLAAMAPAQDLPQFTAMKQASLATGFGTSTLPVLRRNSSTSQADVTSALRAAVCADCSSLTAKQDGNLQSSSERFNVTVSSDGTAADFRDLAVAARSHSQAKPLEQKMSAAVLEKAGLAYITAKLGASIVLGQNEELVPLLTDYRVEGAQDLSTGVVTRSVAANRIVFGRKLNGVPVVGNGSRVVITFANDGSVESFHYDWPNYASTGSQSMVTSSALLGRIQQAVGARSGVPPELTAAIPEQKDAVGHVALNRATQLESMQCGYYDAGADAGLTSVQPGCVYHAVYESPSGMRVGYAGAVPGGEQFASDARWVETQILKEQ
jgi:hypothetical protein